MRHALVVIDYQNDFVSGSLGSVAAALIEESIVERIDCCLASGGRLFFTMDAHGEEYPDTEEGRLIPVAHCVRGSPGWELYGRVSGYSDKGTVVEKETFGYASLPVLLRGFEEIELCGVATNICVLANAVLIKAALPESRVTVREWCVAIYDQDLHAKALDIMAALGIRIVKRG
ncbi:MAG: cysteine hydrolase [Candidatus Methanoplasma sp.]|nr:cysteine hydrolase [Candidatus Methanoplasma sp.]